MPEHRLTGRQVVLRQPLPCFQRASSGRVDRRGCSPRGTPWRPGYSVLTPYLPFIELFASKFPPILSKGHAENTRCCLTIGSLHCLIRNPTCGILSRPLSPQPPPLPRRVQRGESDSNLFVDFCFVDSALQGAGVGCRVSGLRCQKER